MRRVAPVICLVGVVIATVGLAAWTPFAPSAPAPSGGAPAGDVYRGETVFQANCAGCHGDGATGGVGPKLAGRAIPADIVIATVAAGRGAMPSGLVAGQDAADVAAYVASLAG